MGADLEQLTPKMVIAAMSAKFGIDMKPRKAKIKEAIDEAMAECTCVLLSFPLRCSAVDQCY